MARHGHHHRRDLDKGHALKERHAAPDPKANPATIVSVVYVTASPTFDGPVGGYTTIGTPISQPSQTSQRNDDRTTRERESQRQTDSSESTRQTSTARPSRSMVSSTRSALSTPATSSTASRITSSNSMTSTSSQSTTEVSSSTQSEPTTSAVFNTSTPTPAATGNSSSSQASGMSGSAKAGVALGVVLGLGLIFGLVYFLVRKKKRASKEGYIDSDATSDARPAGGEKFTPATDVQLEGRPSSVRTTHTASTAPRLSLRPVTQFEPNLPGERKSAANLLAKEANGAAGATGAQQSTLAVPSPVAQRHGRSSSPTGPSTPETQNPFGANAETVVSPTSTVTSPGTPGKAAAWPPADAVEGYRPMVDGAPTERRPSGPGIGAAVVAAATAASGATARSGVPAPGQASSTSDGNMAVATNHNAPPASPVGSQASSGSVSANGNNDAKAAASPVHRVVLDFSPTMDDELDLRIGQLVRVLHEYDDGWALCLRLDRSEQGVAPRACLSDNPVKPRPTNGSPPGPGQIRTAPPPGWRPKQGGAPSPTAVTGRSTPLGPPPPGSPPDPRAMSPRQMSPVANNGRNSPGPYVAFHPQTSPAPAAYGRNSPVPRAASPYGGPARAASPAGVRQWQGPASPRSGTPPVGKSNSFNSVTSVGPRSGPGPGPVPTRLPTVLRSGSPRPSGSPNSPPSRSASPAPARKPVPGQAL